MAYPGAKLIEFLDTKWKWLSKQSFKVKMIVTQAILGALVYWVDLVIFSYI